MSDRLWLIKVVRVAVAIVGTIAACLPYVGAVVIVGKELGTYHWGLERAFYGVAAFLLLAGLAWLVSLVAIPAVPIEVFLQDDSSVSERACYRIARRLDLTDRRLNPVRRMSRQRKNDGLGERDFSADPALAALNDARRMDKNLRPYLKAVFRDRLQKADDIIEQAAAETFLFTATSQNRRQDAMVALACDFRLIHRLIDNFGSRPSLPRLIELHVLVRKAAILASNLEDCVDLDDVIPGLGLEILLAVPGVSLFLSSILQGTGNAMVTLRLGYVAKAYLQHGRDCFDPREARKVANRTAVAALPRTIRRVSDRLPRLLKTVVDWLFTSGSGDHAPEDPPGAPAGDIPR
jgi:hypothetical protein